MYSNTIVNKVLYAVFISLLSVIPIIPSFGCDCPGLGNEIKINENIEMAITLLSMSDEERAAFMGKYKKPEPIATPETRVKKNITDKGKEGDANDAGVSGGC